MLHVCTFASSCILPRLAYNVAPISEHAHSHQRLLERSFFLHHKNLSSDKKRTPAVGRSIVQDEVVKND